VPQGKKPVEDEDSEEEITHSPAPSKQVSEVGNALTMGPGQVELTPEMEAAIRAALEKQASGPDPEAFIQTLPPIGTGSAARTPGPHMHAPIHRAYYRPTHPSL
jgi:hypothetical protein